MRRALATLFAAALAVAAVHLAFPALGAAEATHSHPAAGAAKLQLDNGKKWATDEPLRRGMSAIRGRIVARHESIHANRMRPQDYAALGDGIEKDVAAIVRDCKLPPAADANLHLVVAELLDAAGKMKGSQGRAGAGQAIAALNAYGRHFAHPGWQSL
jgi:hypothetical protein